MRGDLNKNDRYFTEHFSKLVDKFGGKWIVISRGKKIGIGPKNLLTKFIEEAKEKFPKDIPLIAPIPRKEELQCIL